MTNGTSANHRDGVLSESALATYANRAWHEEQQRLGRTLEEMAALAGKSRPTIVKWRFRLGLTSGRKRVSKNGRCTYANKKWLRTMIEVQQLTVLRVAKEARASVPTIQDWIARFGIVVPQRVSREERMERTCLSTQWLAPLVMKGYSNVAIAQMARCGHGLIARARCAYGLPNVRTLEAGGRIPERACIGKWLSKRLPRTKLNAHEYIVLAYFYGVRHPFRSQQFIARLIGCTRAGVQLVRKRALRKVSNRWRVPARLASFFFTIRKPLRRWPSALVLESRKSAPVCDTVD